MDTIFYAKYPPYEGEGNYLTSKNAITAACHIPEWDAIKNTTPVLQRRLEVVEASLKIARDIQKEKHEQFDKQWQELEENETDLRERFVTFNKFIMENMGKRTRATNKMAADIKLGQIRVRELTELKEKYCGLVETKRKMDEEIGKHALYENYLSECVNCSSDFKSIVDITTRFESFKDLKEVLSVRHIATVQLLAEADNELIKYMVAGYVTIIRFTNDVANLSKRFEQAKHRLTRIEWVVTVIREFTTRVALQMHAVRASIWEIYKLICSRKQMPTVLERDDFRTQLTQVKATLFGLENILEAVVHIPLVFPDKSVYASTTNQ